VKRHLACVALICIVAPGAALAHAFGQRYDLPLPLSFYLAGAGLAVALTFVGSFLFMRWDGHMRVSILIPVPSRLAQTTGLFLRGLALLGLALVMLTAFFGPLAPTQNFANIFVWVIWWVGFVLFTALVVDVWSAANPFATVTDAVLRAFFWRRDRHAPGWTGWLALLGLILLSWTELVSDWPESPRDMGVLISCYMLGLILGSVWLGRRAWFGSADPLTRLFSLLGRLGPLALTPGGLNLRVPGSGLVGYGIKPSGAFFVITLIAIVLFDGLSETPLWAGLLQWVTESQTLRPGLLVLREAGVDLLLLVRTVGLFGTILIAWSLYSVLSFVMWWAAGREIAARTIFTGFAGSLLPIAVAYHLAHYVFFLVLAGQLIVPAASDPFGLGWSLLGDGGGMINAGVMTAQDVWWVAAVALVTGHALSVFVAHAQAMRLFSCRKTAIFSQLPMMVFMVFLTSFSLWVLAQPVVN
jgi:hypothetical protein